MSTPGTTPTSAKIAASLISSRAPNCRRRRRTISRTLPQTMLTSRAVATTPLTSNNHS